MVKIESFEEEDEIWLESSFAKGNKKAIKNGTLIWLLLEELFNGLRLKIRLYKICAIYSGIKVIYGIKTEIMCKKNSKMETFCLWERFTNPTPLSKNSESIVNNFIEICHILLQNTNLWWMPCHIYCPLLLFTPLTSIADINPFKMATTKRIQV